ncbi:MAG: DNA primase [DPANN group archaeon]|nr:DNA primase [DPANN group archaeon]
MGKTYIDTVKYLVRADLYIDGLVETPDAVGAIFGQTEGLLGEELDLRELQKSGRIGRIEVKLNPKNGKSYGEIILPSSLDRIETSILAASLETVDRVGPCEAKIKVTTIEDMRTTKRDQLVDRAKFILRELITDKVPESREISDMVREEVKVAEVETYGPEKLAAGPNIKEAEHIIVVEGRADVLTMLRADIKNVICLQGKNIPQSVIDLSKQKTITLFVDGDRGGDLIIKNMTELGGEVDFIAKAPAGKEVEELTQKEIIKCLRRKEPLEQYMARKGNQISGTVSTAAPLPAALGTPNQGDRREPTHPGPGLRTRRPERSDTRGPREYDRTVTPRATRLPIAIAEKPRVDVPFKEELEKLKGSLKAVLLGKDKKPLAEVNVRDLAKEVENTKDIETIVLDGIVTQRLVDLASKGQVKQIVGIRKSKIENQGNVEISTVA